MEKKFLFSLLLILFQPILALKEGTMVYFIFLNFFLFLWYFLLRVGKERNGKVIFIFLHSHPFPTYFGFKWSQNGIFFFLNFLAIFLKFSIMRRVGTERNRTIISIFSLSLSFPTYFGLKWSYNGIFLFFFYFFSIFLAFSITRREWTKWKINFYFLSLSSIFNLFWL